MISLRLRKIVRLSLIFPGTLMLFSIHYAGEVSPSADAVFRKGKEVFFRTLDLAFGIHPLKFRLIPEDIKRIENAEADIPCLYENLINITYQKESAELKSLLRENSEDSLKKFEARFIELSKNTAEFFVRSLFVGESTVSRRNKQKSQPGSGRLDLILSSFQGKKTPDRGIENSVFPEISAIEVDTLWGFRMARIPEASGFSEGEGVKIRIITSGFGRNSEPGISGILNSGACFSLVGHRLAPWNKETVSAADESGIGTVAASLVAWVCPESDIAVFKIVDDPASRFVFWPAMQAAGALYKAVYEGADVILLTAVFGRDFDFLREACQFAYENNVVVVCSTGDFFEKDPGKPYSFPAHYTTTIATAGVVPDSRNNPRPWKRSGASHYVSLAAPAFIGDSDGMREAPPALSGSRHAWAAALTCGLAGLLSSRIPKTGDELGGQYFQRIYEIMIRSANPRILGFRNFNPKTGYGLIDAEKTLGEGLQAYLEKMKTIEDNFKKRMAERKKRERGSTK